MKNCARSLFIILTCVLIPAPYGYSLSAVSPEEILKRVDEIRCPNGDYTAIAMVTIYRQGQYQSSSTYEIMAKGHQKTIIETLHPDNERGRMILMSEGDYWAFFPEVSQPLRIAALERLVGDVFHGDLARTNFFGDYDATILREESSVEKKYYVLELKAKNDKATYSKVMLWVEQKRFWPLKAELYSRSGRLLKTCLFENYKIAGGTMRPSRLVLQDAIVEGEYSVIEYHHFKFGDIPAKYFSKEYLKKKVF